MMTQNKQRFFVGLEVPSPYKEYIRNIQHEFAKNYYSQHALKSPPHITLIPPFDASIETINVYISLLKEQQRKPLTLELKNFGAFPPRVIFVQPILTQELQQLYTSTLELTQKFFAEHKLGPLRTHKEFHPHVSVAFRDLSPAQFERAWEVYEHQNFYACYPVKSLEIFIYTNFTWKTFCSLPF